MPASDSVVQAACAVHMEYLDLSFPTPPENLACDEALLESAESGETGEVLRFWEAHNYFVVVGYANQVAREVNLAACKARGIPVYRRCTGGGAVLIGPGCLNYTLILQIQNEILENVTSTNRFVMERNCGAIAALLREATLPGLPNLCGTTDLAIGNRKFSGNSQRRRRRALLFHGTFLLNFDIGLVDVLLPLPSRQPDYRQSRAHSEFMTNLGLSAEAVKTALRTAWGTINTLRNIPIERIRALVAEKYSVDSWNFKL